jgi:hypothetical protein
MLKTRAQDKLEAGTSCTGNVAAKAPASSIGRAYEWFLQLPVGLVLVALWLCGVLLMSTCVVLLHLVWALLFGAVGVIVSIRRLMVRQAEKEVAR